MKIIYAYAQVEKPHGSAFAKTNMVQEAMGGKPPGIGSVLALKT